MQNLHSPVAPPPRILLVDDFLEIRELLSTMLVRLGYEVDVAGDGASGWEAFCSKRYDLLVTDNDMPVLSGLEFVRQVRAIPDMLPVIVISGFAPWDDADVNSLLRPGAFIEKPFTFPILRAKVEELMKDKWPGSNGDSSATGQPLPLQPEHDFQTSGATRGPSKNGGAPLAKNDTATTV